MKHGAKILGGAAVGAVNGLFGGGGGMIAVPILRAGGRGERAAHANAIAVVLPATFVSALIYLLHGFVTLRVLLPVAIGSAAGGVCGAKLLKVTSGPVLEFIFSLFMLVAGLRMLF